MITWVVSWLVSLEGASEQVIPASLPPPRTLRDPESYVAATRGSQGEQSSSLPPVGRALSHGLVHSFVNHHLSTL